MLGPLKATRGLKGSPFLVVALAVLVSLIAACTQAVPATPTPLPKAVAPQEPAAKPTPAPAKEAPAAQKPPVAEKKPVALQKMKVILTAVSSMQVVPWIAKEKGLFERYGLDVELATASGSPMAVGALMSGEAQLIVGAQDAVISANFAGSDLVFLASGPIKLTTRLLGKTGVTSPVQLKGGKVGLGRFGTSAHFGAKYSLRQLGLDPASDVTLVQLGGQPEILGALTSGAVDGAVIAPQYARLAERQGLKILFDTNLANLRYHTSGIIARKSWIQGREETIRNFLKAYVEGMATAKKDKQFAMNVIGKFTNVTDPETLADSYGDLMAASPDKPYALTEALKTTLDDMVDEPKAKTADPNQFIDNRFVEELDKSGFIDNAYK
ncbi:MAG: ABC transporter substrate-binding protein [Chloroflexi bacterium]|nr:ABC transporter substrate-binding protein [Chloroflexota bacterium]